MQICAAGDLTRLQPTPMHGGGTARLAQDDGRSRSVNEDQLIPRSRSPRRPGRRRGQAADAVRAWPRIAVRDAAADRPPSRALASALVGRAAVLRIMSWTAEAAGDARRSLALAREIGYPAGEMQALAELSLDAHYADDHDEAVRLASRADHGRDPRPARHSRTRRSAAPATRQLSGFSEDFMVQV